MDEMMLQQYIQLLGNCVKGYRHKWYLHTVNKAEFYRQIVTGEGQEALIVSYKERETEAQKEQRIMSHSERALENRRIRSKQKQKEARMTRNDSGSLRFKLGRMGFEKEERASILNMGLSVKRSMEVARSVLNKARKIATGSLKLLPSENEKRINRTAKA